MDPGTPLPTTPAPPAAQSDSTAKIVYILYLVALVSGVTALIGVVLAYVNAGDAPEPLRTHYRFQIRTFWIAILYCLAAGLLTITVVGALSWIFVAVWFIVRCAKGLQSLGRGEPYPNAATWLW
jgi:uncharacterized membrane protein